MKTTLKPLRLLSRRFAVVAGIALAASTALPGCSRGESFQQENHPENLRALFEHVHKSVHQKRDAREAATVFQSLMPDEARAKKALKGDAAPTAVQRIVDQHNALRAEIRDDQVHKLARPEQTVVKVHAATTEEIAKYQKDSVASREFPGGARLLAQQILRPGMTFYEVEFLEPSKDAGKKYHLFYWDGGQWSMLGPMWRVLN